MSRCGTDARASHDETDQKKPRLAKMASNCDVLMPMAVLCIFKNSGIAMSSLAWIMERSSSMRVISRLRSSQVNSAMLAAPSANPYRLSAHQ